MKFDYELNIDKVYTLKTPWDEEYKVKAFALRYLLPDRLSVSLFDIENCEPFLDVTVNIPYESVSGDDCAFVDTNNYPWICKFLEDNHLATSTGYIGMSDYCTYPEYKFDLSKLSKEGDESDGSM